MTYGDNSGAVSCDRDLEISALHQKQDYPDEAFVVLAEYDLGKIVGNRRENVIARNDSLKY